MKDCLLDIIKHTISVSTIDIIKIESQEDRTVFSGLTDDRQILLQAETILPVSGFTGTFGIPNIKKLQTILSLEPYKENASCVLEKNDKDEPTNLHFETDDGTFKNDHRFMSSAIIEQRLKTLTLAEEEKWSINITPTQDAIKRLQYQSIISDEELVLIEVVDKLLIMKFGGPSTHAGEFVFSDNIDGPMPNGLYWLASAILPILKLRESEEVLVSFSERGLLRITAISSIGVYDYLLSPQTR